MSKKETKESAGQMRTPISFQETVFIILGTTCQAWGAGHIVGVPENVCRVNFVFIYSGIYLLSANTQHPRVLAVYNEGLPPRW